MLDAIVWAALGMALVSFVLFVWAMIKSLSAKPSTLRDPMAGRQEGVLSADALAKLAEAAAKLVEALNKSGPPVLGLFASIVFLVIALLALGGAPAPVPMPAG